MKNFKTAVTWKVLLWMLSFNLIIHYAAHAQDTKKITGTVTGADVQPLSGISVTLKGTTTGTTTDAAGKFSIQAKAGDVLTLSGIGFQTQEIRIGTEENLSIQMVELKGNLNEVVVIGYGTQKRKEVTGATVRVSGSDLEKNQSVSTLQALQGQAPGVQVLSNSGQPGDAIKIRIRGLATNGNSNPLYVVDGMQTDDIGFLNPADIENLDVLKDAASAAIYGTRGANGVVLITTRRGRSGKKTLGLNVSYGWQNPTRRMDLLNAKEYAIIMNESALNSGRGPYAYFSQHQIDSMGAGTDWQKEVTNEDAVLQRYDLNFSGGNEQSIYAGTLGYQKQEGILGLPGKSLFERISFRFNSSHDIYKNIIRIGENLTYTRTRRSGVGTGNIYTNSMRPVLNTSPTFPVYNADGSYAKSNISPEEMNPVAAMDILNNNKHIEDRIFGDVYIEATILKGLKFRSDFGLDATFNTGNVFIPVYELASNNVNQLSTADMTAYRNYTWNWDNTITYQRSFGDHNLTFMVGTTAQEYDGFVVEGLKQDLTIPDFQHAVVDNGREGTQKAWGTRSEYALNAYFGRISYNYADKYLFTGIVRRDGSTRFGVNNRWATFPSFSAGWIASNEDFLKNVYWLNFLKVRGGWGQNGNDRIGDYLYLATVSSLFNGYYFGGNNTPDISIGTAPDKIPNPNLKWEASEQTNIGFDATVFKHFNVTVDFYHKTTKDWLVEAKVPDLVGTGAPYINGGDIVNKGVEIGLNYQRTIGELTLNLGGNIAFNKNEARQVPNPEGILHGSPNVLSSSTEEFYRIENGFPVGYFWGYQTAGVFQNEQEVNAYTGKTGGLIQPSALPGDVRFVDRNGDGVISVLDKTQIGNPIPTHTYGINIGASWKGFDVSILMSGVGGNDIVDGTRANDRFLNNYSTQIFNRWHGEGTSTKLPRITMGDEPNRNYSNFSDLYVSNGAYLRVKSVNIGYDLKKKLLPNWPVQQMRFFVSGLNLLTFTHYKGIDPEVGYGAETWASGIDLGYYPQARTILLGLNVKF